MNILQDIVDQGINVVLTAHAQIRKFEQPDEMGAYDRYELKLGKKTSARTSALVKEWADMVLFINYKTYSVAADDRGRKHKAQGGTRIMFTTHHPAWDAKNRHGLPDELPLDYVHIAHIFESHTQQPQTWSSQPPMQQVGPQQPPQLSPGIPTSLQDLMMQSSVTEQEVQQVVSEKGYYPPDTPLANYDPGFIEGVLVGAWQQVYRMILEIREQNLPF